MAQTGYTPILIYASGTTGNTPSAANLTSSASGAELAINYFDGKLFYKDNAGVVQVLATKGTGAIGGSNTQVQYNSSGALAGSANLTFDGTTLTANALTVTNNPTLSGGTANGVLYLNGSKVATSGTALAFNGTSLLVGKNSSDANNWGVQNYATNAFGSGMQLTYGGVGSAGVWVPAASSLAFGADAGSGTTELMRLTSTGLGIGTSSPGIKLQVAGPVGVTDSFAANQTSLGGIDYQGATTAIRYFAWGPNGTVGQHIWFSGSGGSPATERMRLDSSGNLGLGVTPSAWATYKATQVGWSALAGYAAADTAVFSNAFFDGGYKYIGNGFASQYRQINSAHQWYTAPSGTAGNAISFTQAMTLDASGNLTLGQTSSALQSGGTGITLYGASNSEIKFLNSSTGQNATDGTALLVTSLDFQINNREAGAILFGTSNSERARITSGGDLLVGTTTNNGKLYVVGLTNSVCARFEAAASATGGLVQCINTNTSGSNTAIAFEQNSTAVGSITTSNANTTYNTSSDYRLKDNPQPLTGSGAFIDALQPKTWNWKADGSRGVGFIAHEAQAVSPSSVVGEKDAVDEDGKPVMQAMEYGSAEFIANIIAELQSLRARVAALEKP